jgi:flagellar hook assembly protein FlgD
MCRFALILFLEILVSCDSKKLDSYAKHKQPTKDGIVKSYSKNGQLKAELTLKDGKRNGICKNFFPNGKMSLEINYADNLKNGISKRYYESGLVFQETEYQSDQINGLKKKYREDGKLMSIMRYEKDNPCSGLKEFMPDGTQKRIYPKLLIQPVNRLEEKGEYTLILALTEKVRKIHFYKGKLTSSGCLHSGLESIYYNEKTKKGELKYYLSPGGFLMEEVNIIATFETALGNEYIVEEKFNVAIDN